MDVIKAFEFFIGIKRKETPKNFDYKPTVTILIPAYNESKIISKTIENMKMQTYPIQDILVVDDCSDDNTNDVAKNLGVKVVRTSKNTGAKSRAQNYALDYVNTDVVVTVDADTILKPDAIEKIIPMLSDGETLSACGFVIPMVRKTIFERARFIEYLYGIGLFKNTQEYYQTPLVSSGCFSAFNMKILNEMGRFPEGNIAEDMTLTWKGYINKKKIKFEHSAICYPKDPENLQQFVGQVSRWYHGFFQCISMYKREILANKKLATFVYGYLGISLIAILTQILFIIFLIRDILFGISSILYIVSIALIIEVIISFSVVVANAYKIGLLKEAIIDYPLMWIVYPINMYLFIEALINEWILGRKLDTWIKGH